MNVPKLRFKEFNDEWSYQSLSKYVNRITTKNKNNESNLVLTISAQYGLVDQTNFFNRSVSSSNLTGYYLLNNGDFAYNKSYSNGYPWGAVKRLNKYNQGVVSSLYICFKPNDLINSDFLEQYFETNKWYQQISEVSVEGARNHGLLNIAVNDFFNTKHYIPSIKEQEKISNFLSLLDKKIELQSKKIEDLKLFKKGLILSLKKNSFDWHTVCIKDLFKITRGVVIPKNELSEFKNGEYKYPVYSSQTSNEGILGYSDTFDFNGKYLTWTTDGANAGKVFYRNGKFRCTNVCGVLYEDNIIFTNELFAELLNYETPKHVSYVGNPKLMNNVMANIKIKIPNGDVQENTSLIINTINNKVNLENNKLSKLFLLKKGLMQNMFV